MSDDASNEGLPTVAVTQQHPNSKHIDVEQVLLYYSGNREGYHYGKPIRPCYIDALEEATEHEVGEVNELVRRSDVKRLFRLEQDARELEDLSRRLQAAATNPFDKEAVLTVARELSDLSNERAKLLEELEGEASKSDSDSFGETEQ